MVCNTIYIPLQDVGISYTFFFLFIDFYFASYFVTKPQEEII